MQVSISLRTVKYMGDRHDKVEIPVPRANGDVNQLLFLIDRIKIDVLPQIRKKEDFQTEGELDRFLPTDEIVIKLIEE